MGSQLMPWLAGLDEDKKKRLEVANASSRLKSMSSVPVFAADPVARLTSIICTLGPASCTEEVLMKMFDAGMRVARFNFSHGSYESHEKLLNTVRATVSEYSRRIGRVFPLAIALDTKGPEIRTGMVVGDGKIKLNAGDPITITTDESKKEQCTEKEIYVDYVNITKVCKQGDHLYIDDGLVSLTINEVGSNFLKCTVDNSGVIGSKKGCNLPGVPVDLPTLSEKDKKDLAWGVEHDVDMVFASFMRSGDAVKEVRAVLGEKGKGIMVIPKIENHQGVEDIDSIIDACDAMMIARGDLGIEIPPPKVACVQKMMIGKCNDKGKPIIIATQMLDSMQAKPRPTRAEITDVANAVLDGGDCTMLSGESASGLYPVECVSMMSGINREAEEMRYSKQYFQELCDRITPPVDPAHAVAIAAVETSLKVVAAAIVVITTSGRSAKLISQYRPRCPVIAVTRFSQVARQLQIWGCVDPVQYISPPLPDWQKDVDARIQFGITCGKKAGYIKPGDAIVIVSGWRQGAGFTNTLRVLYASTQDCTAQSQ